MELDDAGTYLHLRQIREQIIDPTIVQYGGHVINTAGDEILAEFNSAAAALQASIDMQRALAARNNSLSPDDRIEYRIGINLGDVIVDGDRIAGDGINVAARLAALAAPGGVCLSGSVHEQVHRNIDIGFFDGGKQHVKNIERPIQVYRVDLESRRLSPTGNARGRWRLLARAPWVRRFAVGTAALGLAGVLAWMPSRLWKTATTLSPPALSIAILPFAAPTTREDNQFADTFTQDLTMALGRAHFARVVSPGLASTYKGKSIDARAVGRELDVRYLVQGEVSRIGDQVMLTAHFIDTRSGMDVWSDRMQLDQTRPAEARDELLSRLAARLRDALVDSEQRRAAALSRTDAHAIDFLLQGNALENRDPNTLRGALAARKLYDEALQLDPDLVPALIGRARTLVYELDLNPHADRDHLLGEMDELTSRAITIDGNSPLAWVYRAEALWRQWRWEAALEANAKAGRLDPTFSAAPNQRAVIMNNMGRPVEALALVNQAAALEHVGSTGMEQLTRCIAYMTLDRYGEAIAACEKSAANNDWWLAHLYLTAAYAHDDNNTKVAAEKARLWKQQPGFTISDFKALHYSDNPTYWQQTETHLLSGLRKAGIPEK